MRHGGGVRGHASIGMTLQQRSKSELNEINAIFAELGFGETPIVKRKHDLDVLLQDMRGSEGTDSARKREVGACGKVSYGSQTAALRTARIRMNSGACRLRVYSCPECKGWHLTHSIGRKKRQAFKQKDEMCHGAE